MEVRIFSNPSRPGVGLKPKQESQRPLLPQHARHCPGMARAFVVPEDFGTPPGAITLRGAYNFGTLPDGDTVYTSVLNMVDRPIAPMLVVRVETDWYMHEALVHGS